MKGQTLIEVLIALGIAGVVISAVTVVVTASLNNAQYSKNQNQAVAYAQEAMEVIRQIRDSDIVGFRTYTGNYCLAKGQTTLGSAQANCILNVDNFVRSVLIDQSPGCANNVAKVTVNVAWTDGKCPTNSYCHKIPLVSCLLTTNPVSGP